MNEAESERLAAMVKACVAATPDVLLAILHGSVAEGRAASHSDVDVAVAGAAALAHDRLDELRLRVEEATGRAADVVDLHHADGVFLAETLRRGRVLLNRRPSLLAGLMIRMLGFQEDLLPAVRLIRQRNAEALAHGS